MPKGFPKNGINSGWFKIGQKIISKNHIRKGHPSYESADRKRKISESHSGKKHWNWKGGISSLNSRIRQSPDYKKWRVSVFQRDRFTCVECGYISKGTRPSDIEADHIKPFSSFPELRFVINNGRTLCRECHKKTPNYKGNGRKKIHTS